MFLMVGDVDPNGAAPYARASYVVHPGATVEIAQHIATVYRATRARMALGDVAGELYFKLD